MAQTPQGPFAISVQSVTPLWNGRCWTPYRQYVEASSWLYGISTGVDPGPRARVASGCLSATLPAFLPSFHCTPRARPRGCEGVKGDVTEPEVSLKVIVRVLPLSRSPENLPWKRWWPSTCQPQITNWYIFVKFARLASVSHPTAVTNIFHFFITDNQRINYLISFLNQSIDFRRMYLLLHFRLLSRLKLTQLIVCIDTFVLINHCSQFNLKDILACVKSYHCNLQSVSQPVDPKVKFQNSIFKPQLFSSVLSAWFWFVVSLFEDIRAYRFTKKSL